MIRAYLTIAIRHLLKNRVYSFINVVGLGLGIAAFGLILEYVAFERSVNQFHTQLPTLYRLLQRKSDGGIWVDQTPGVATLAKREFPEVRAFCRVGDHSANGTVTPVSNRGGGESFRESRLAYADASFFTLFTFPLVRGMAAAALTQPNTVALSASQAQKYFGRANPVGKALTLNNQFGKTLYTVSAVYADMPANSDFQFDAIFALETLANPANLGGNSWARLDGFEGEYLTTFLQLTPAAQPAGYRVLEAKINAFAKQLNPADETHYLLQPAGQMHLAASLSDPYRTTGSLGFIYLLSSIAGLVLLIAWFNYVNLATAGALKRAKEVGVRKVIGAETGQLVGQFLGESLLLNALGLGVGMLLIALIQTPFNAFVQKDLSLHTLTADRFWLVGLGLLLLGGLVSGGYVALTTTAFRPNQILKGLPASVGRGGWLRPTLVVVQFSVSVGLIIGTLVLYRQMQYMQRANLGLQLSQRVVIQGPQGGDGKLVAPRTAALESQLTQLPYVRNFCQTGMVPGNGYNFTASPITRPNSTPEAAKQIYSMGIVDDRYLKTYGIMLAAGRNFTSHEAEQGWEKSNKLLINETAVRRLGFASSAAAVGQSVHWNADYEIVGVVQDYHHQGLREAIDPIIFMPRRSAANLTVQLTTGDMPRQMAELERLYKASYPGNPFEYYFVDERYNEQYQTERQYSQVFTLASGLAIFIACLGLFGLATFTAEQRTKEIGIRKVLGASVSSIVVLLSGDFLRLVVVAILIATPLSWWAMSRWLEGFAYRIELSGWMLAVAGALAILIALLTVSYQSIRAALVNPIKSLRSE